MIELLLYHFVIVTQCSKWLISKYMYVMEYKDIGRKYMLPDENFEECNDLSIDEKCWKSAQICPVLFSSTRIANIFWSFDKSEPGFVVRKFYKESEFSVVFDYKFLYQALTTSKGSTIFTRFSEIQWND